VENASGHEARRAAPGPRGSHPRRLVAVEVELERKTANRLGAILSLYARWLAEDRVTGVIYVCASKARADSITAAAAEAELPNDALRTELLDDVRTQAIKPSGRIKVRITEKSSGSKTLWRTDS
jgi:hypothetical protein